MLVKIMRNHDYQKFSQFAQHIQRTLAFFFFFDTGISFKKKCAITEVEVLEANKTNLFPITQLISNKKDDKYINHSDTQFLIYKMMVTNFISKD